MIQKDRVIRGTTLLGLSLLGLALVWLFLSSVSVVQATSPIGGDLAVTTTLNPARAVGAADLGQNGRPDLTFGQRGFLQGAGNTCDVVFDGTGFEVGPLDPTNGMVIGDLNGDGLPDIVTDRFEGFNHLYAWMNNGTPFSTTWPLCDLGENNGVVPRALADFDDDDDLDIVAVNRYDQRLQIWQNDGDFSCAGTWSFHTAATLSAGASALAVGDLDGNDTLEIVVGIVGSSSISPTIEIWHFEGDPFATSWISAEVAVVTYTVNSIALGDLNDDEQLDIVFGTDHAPSVPDPNPDTYPDVYQLRAARNDGAPFLGGWTLFDLGRDPQWSGLVPWPNHGYWGADVYSVDVADFDNDGDLDIATGEGYEGDHQVMVWENDGTPFDGQLWSPTTAGLGEGTGGPWLWDTARSVVAADFNGDGWIDLVSGSHSAEPNEIIYWENSGIPFSELVTDTHWIRHDVGALDGDALLVGAADLDSDGDMDIASLTDLSWGDPVVHVWENKTAGCVAGLSVEANPSSIPADGTSTSVVTATVTDAYGNPVMDGTVVTFTTTLGSFPTAPYATTTFGGVATATLTSSTTVGTAVVTATAMTASDQITVTFTASSVADVNVEANPTSIPADGTSTSVVTATVTDAYGYPVANGTVVTFTTTLGSFPTAPYTTTTFGGVATATLTSSTTVGTAVVTATAGTASGQTTVNFASSSPTEVYLPLIFKSGAGDIAAPDLVVEQVITTNTSVRVVIKNQGDAPVLAAGEFWVDFYIDPNPPPSGVNQTWDYPPGRCIGGLVWEVTAPALPLKPGETFTLTFGDNYYRSGYSSISWPLAPGTPIYVQVDSANVHTTYGAVLENHEIASESYNNISSTISAMVQAAGVGTPVKSESPPTPSGHAPPRP